jgi:hypothetical protein
MSLVFERFLNGELHQVEVTREGELIFPDYNIAHDQAALEFGYDHTDATMLKEEWDEYAVEALIYDVVADRIEPKYMARIVLEFAARSLHIEKRAHPGDDRAQNLLDASAEYLNGALDRQYLKALRTKLRGFGEYRGKRRGSDSEMAATLARMAAYLASGAAFHCDTGRSANWKLLLHNIFGATDKAAAAIAYDVCVANDTPAYVIKKVIMSRGRKWRLRNKSDAFDDAAAVESAWQIRRFVDVMEAVGQGFDWPDIKVTP